MTATDDHQSSAAPPDPPRIPLPPQPETDPLTAEQWGILAAIADTVVPSFTASKGNRLLQHPLRTHVYQAAQNRIAAIAGAAAAESSDDLIGAYMAENATAQPEFRSAVQRLVAYGMDETGRSGLLNILNALK